jgi:hypothetical protein
MFICAVLRLELKCPTGGLLPRRSHCTSAGLVRFAFSLSGGQRRAEVSHRSTSPSRKPERPGLSLESSREDAVSSNVRGARNLGPFGAFRTARKECPHATERICHPGRSGEGLHPDKVPNRARVHDRKRRANPSDCGSTPLAVRARPDALNQDFLPPSDHRSRRDTRSYCAVLLGALHIECSGEAQFEQGLREP